MKYPAINVVLIYSASGLLIQISNPNPEQVLFKKKTERMNSNFLLGGSGCFFTGTVLCGVPFLVTT